MKKHVFLLFIIVLFNFVVKAQTWITLNSGTTNGLTAVSAPAQCVAYIAGANGTILKTTDGGNTWVAQVSGTTQNLYSIYFTGVNTGYAVGDNGTAIQTTDGGTTWTPMVVDSTNTVDLRDIRFFNSQIGFATGGTHGGGTGYIYRTTDGGITWTNVLNTDNYAFYSTFFTSATTGYAANGTGKIYQTTDGGTTWNVIGNVGALSNGKIYFPSPANGVHPNNNGQIFTTGNSGVTWNQTPSGTSDDLIGIDFYDSNNGFMVGGNFPSAGVILASTDGGATWTNVPIPAGTPGLESVDFFDNSIGYSVGVNGTILRQTNLSNLNVNNSNPTTICLGGSANLTAGGANTYIWTPSASLNTATGASVIATPTVTTTYTIIGTINCIMDTIYSTVTVNNCTLQSNSGLVACYPFNGNANDASGNGNNGTVHGATLTTDRFGNANSAYSFNGTTDYISVPSAAFLNNDYSYSYWFKEATSPPSPNPYYTISIGTPGQAGAEGFATAINATMGIQGEFYPTSPVSIQAVNVGSLPIVNQWYHVVVTRDAYNLKLFVNGSLVNTLATNGNIPQYGMTPIFTIGERYNSTYNFDGAIDDIQIYNRAITSQEVTNLYNTTSLCCPTPIITITPNTNVSICQGSSITFIANGADSYIWSPAAGLNMTTGATVTATPTVTTTYTVTGTNSCGTNTAVSTITILNLPIIAVNSATVCAGVSSTLTASGATTYTWSPTNGLSSVTGSLVLATPLNTTTYSIVGTDINGCANSTTTLVNVHQLPVISCNSTTICAGSTAILTATGANSYTWTPATGLSANTGATVTVTPTTTSTYNIAGTDINGCISSTNSTVSITHPTNITVNSDTLCAGDSTVLIANGANSYSWLPTASLSSTSGQIVKAFPSITTTYSVIGTDGCGSNTAISTVLVYPSPSAVLISNNIGCQSLSATIKGMKGRAPYTFTYLINGAKQTPVNSGADTSDIANLSSNNFPLGTYTYSIIGVSDANNCFSSINNEFNTINVYPKPSALFSVDPFKTTALKSAITIKNESIGGIGWLWDFGDSSKSFLQNPESHTYADTGTYRVQLVTTTQYGCKDSTYQSIVITQPFVLYIPNAFSPNGDTFNDVFAPKGEGILKYEMYIYSRWGEEVFYTNDLNVGWNGKVNGGNETAPMDSYVYDMNVKSATDKHDYTYRGTVSLVK